MSEKTLRICHLYPDLLNLYGDRGNILCMRRRLEWRGIGAEVTEVTVGQQADFTRFDLFFIGGGQDFEQEVLLSDLKAGKGGEIKAAIADGKTFLTICGGYQMLGETIIDEVESGLGTQPGLGLLNTVTHFAHSKTTTQVTATLAPALPAWLAATAGLAVSGYEIHMGETELRDGCRSLMQLHKGGLSVADGAVSDDGLAFGTYLHGLFDTGELTEKLVAALCARKGIAPDTAALMPMEQYRQQQFDLLAEGVRKALDMDALYAAMGLARKEQL